MHRILINKCIDKKLSVKVSKCIFIFINLLVIGIAIYVFKSLWKNLKKEEEELNRQKLLKNTEQPIDELLSMLTTRKAVLITTVTTALIVSSIGVIGAYKHNTLLIALYDIFCAIISIILALGYHNYVHEYPLYYSLALSITSIAAIIGFILIRVLKVEPQWVKHRQLLMNSKNSI